MEALFGIGLPEFNAFLHKADSMQPVCLLNDSVPVQIHKRPILHLLNELFSVLKPP